MLHLLDRDPHGERLRDLLRRFRAEELSLMAALVDCEEQLDLVHGETGDGGNTTAPALQQRLQRGRELQAECDLIATELVHVRMAIAGARDELDQYVRPRFAPTRHSGRLVTSA